MRAIYVDDANSGADSTAEAFELNVKAKERLREEGLNLHKFVTNSEELRNLIQDTLWEITGISYGNKSWPNAHSNQMGHTLPTRVSWP